jgi:hypothetical protein
MFYATWSGRDVFTIRIIGTCEYVRQAIERLVEDFEAPRENDEDDSFDDSFNKNYSLGVEE